MKPPQALRLVNQRVRELRPYHLAPEPASIKLNQNESPFDWPGDVKRRVGRYCVKRPWNRYPDFIPDALKKSLAAHVGWRPDGVIAGNGSNEMLLVLLLSLAGRGKTVIVCQPTFSVYRLLARGLGSEYREVFLRQDLSFDVERIVDAARDNPGSVLILASPNSPTGGALSKKEIERILGAHTGFLILDQAYAEFGGYNAIPLLRRHPNLIVTRTFSKALAGAGLRLGYMLGAPEVIGEMNKIKLPYNVNFFSDYAARVILSAKSATEKRVAEIMRRRDELYEMLRRMPFDNCYPSAANFVLVRTALMPGLRAFLGTRGILVRDVSSNPMLENCLRISAGSRREQAVLKAALTAFFEANR